MFVYFWRDWTATVQGEGWRAVDCAHCGRHFEYGIQGEGVGTAHDPYCGYDEKAKRVANKRAAKDLAQKLADAPVPMPCPGCGNYQPAMVRVMKHGLFPLFFRPSWMVDRLEVLVALFGLLGLFFFIGSLFGTDPFPRIMGCVFATPFTVLYSIRFGVFLVQSIRRATFDPYKDNTTEERMTFAEQMTVPHKPMAEPILSPVFADEPAPRRRATPVNSPIFDD